MCLGLNQFSDIVVKVQYEMHTAHAYNYKISQIINYSFTTQFMFHNNI